MDFKDLIQKANKMRQNPTPHEEIAESILKTRGESYYKNQVVFGFYILDFVIPEKALIVEIDGDTHKKTKRNDSRRDTFCLNCGLRTLRVKNEDVGQILQKIDKYQSIEEPLEHFIHSLEVSHQRALYMELTIKHRVHQLGKPDFDYSLITPRRMVFKSEADE